MNRRLIHRYEKSAARSGLKSTGSSSILAWSRIQTFDTRINGVRTNQWKTGSIRVIDSHDRWVDDGALHISRFVSSRNPCQEFIPQGKRFRSKNPCYHELSFLADIYVDIYA